MTDCEAAGEMEDEFLDESWDPRNGPKPSKPKSTRPDPVKHAEWKYDKFQIKPSYIPEGEGDSPTLGKHMYQWLPTEVDAWAKKTRIGRGGARMREKRQELVRLIWLHGGVMFSDTGLPMTASRLQASLDLDKEALTRCFRELWEMGWLDVTDLRYSPHMGGKNAGRFVVPRMKKAYGRKKITSVDKGFFLRDIARVGSNPTEQERNFKRLIAAQRLGRESLEKKKQGVLVREPFPDWGKKALELLRQKANNPNLRVNHIVANSFQISWEKFESPEEAANCLAEKHFTPTILTKRSAQKIEVITEEKLKNADANDCLVDRELIAEKAMYVFKKGYNRETGERKDLVVLMYEGQMVGLLEPKNAGFNRFGIVGDKLKQEASLLEISRRLYTYACPGQMTRGQEKMVVGKYLCDIIAEKENIPFSLDYKQKAMEWAELNPEAADYINCAENVQRWLGQDVFLSLGIIECHSPYETAVINRGYPYVKLPALTGQILFHNMKESAALARRFGNHTARELDMFLELTRFKEIQADRRSAGLTTERKGSLSPGKEE